MVDEQVRAILFKIYHNVGDIQRLSQATNIEVEHLIHELDINPDSSPKALYELHDIHEKLKETEAVMTKLLAKGD